MMASAWSQKQPTMSGPDPNLALFIIPQLDIVLYLLIRVALRTISYNKFDFCFIRSQWDDWQYHVLVRKETAQINSKVYMKKNE